MAEITTNINGIDGTVRIDILDGHAKQCLELRWCRFNSSGDTGFMTSFSDEPYVVTEVAAEQFLNILLASIVNALDVDSCKLTIKNHLGEDIDSVQFLPPTFVGNEGDIRMFVSRQDMLGKFWNMYQETNELSAEYLEHISEGGVLDDFLSLLQIKINNNTLNLGDNTNG